MTVSCMILDKSIRAVLISGYENLASFSLLAPRQNQRNCSDEHYHSSRPSEEVGPAAVYSVSHDLPIVRNQHNHYQQRRRQKAIDNCREEERSNRIDAREIDQDSHQSGNDNYAIEEFGSRRFLIEAISPSQGSGHSVCTRSRQDG